MLALDDRLTRRVGMVTIVVGIVAIVFTIAIAPGLAYRDARRIRVAFHHAGGLHEGAPLVVAGREVGVVESIATVTTATGGVVATVAIAAEVAGDISRGGDVFVASRGPLGDKYLELGAAPEAGHPYVEGELVVGRDPPQMDRVMQRTWADLVLAKSFVDELRPGWQAFAAQVVALRDNLDAARPSTLRGGELGVQLDAFAAELRQLRDGALGGPD
ncbi:MAG: MlaD family protein, partial [Proteobacteria bacterium]|nr:MlaD family protein [Pseudomonadota bacterium]